MDSRMRENDASFGCFALPRARRYVAGHCHNNDTLVSSPDAVQPVRMPVFTKLI